MEELHALPYLETYEDLLISPLIDSYIDNEVYKLLIKGHHYTNSRYKVKIESEARLIKVLEQKKLEQLVRSDEMNLKLLGIPMPNRHTNRLSGSTSGDVEGLDGIPILNEEEDDDDESEGSSSNRDNSDDRDILWDLSQVTAEQVSDSMAGLCIVFPSGWWNYEWCHRYVVYIYMHSLDCVYFIVLIVCVCIYIYIYMVTLHNLTPPHITRYIERR